MQIPDHVVSRTVNLAFNAAQALSVPRFRWIRSIGGKRGSLSDAPPGFQTESAAFAPFFSTESLARLLRVTVSVPLPGREASGPIPYAGEYAGAHPRERWLFINGICTDRRMALINAEMLSRMFGRPFTILYNTTGGFLWDLAESAVGKSWDGITEAVVANLPEFTSALEDPEVDRVVLVAHSQGTILAAVLLKLLEEILHAAPDLRTGAGTGPVSPERRVARRIAGTGPAGAAEQPRDAEPHVRRARQCLTTRDVGKLEVYCFANCATSMEPFVAIGSPPRHAPWIESYGNEYDLVAKLGLLAPPHGIGSARIAGDRYRRLGAWGHLLNAHYLAPILADLAEPRVGLEPFHDNLRRTPRLLEYLNGGRPGAHP